MEFAAILLRRYFVDCRPNASSLFSLPYKADRRKNKTDEEAVVSMKKHGNPKGERRLCPNTNPFAEMSTPMTNSDHSTSSSTSSSSSDTDSSSSSESDTRDERVICTSEVMKAEVPHQNALCHSASNVAIPAASISIKQEPTQPNEAVLSSKRRRNTHRNRNLKPSYRKQTLYDSGDDEDGSPATAHLASVSLEAMKERILGRKLHSSTDYLTELCKDEPQPAELPRSCSAVESSAPAIASQGTDAVARSYAPADVLRKDCTCVICHEILYQPVSLFCGHSFCQSCIQWWFQNKSSNAKSTDPHLNRTTCPTCRQPSSASTFALGINTALRACVMTLFSNDLQSRIRAEVLERRRAVAGELNGRHGHGYFVVSPISEEPWTKVPSMDFMARRSTVMDSDDQRMQLFLAFASIPVPDDVSNRGEENNLNFSLCLLMLEEDEAQLGSIPLLVRNQDDQHFITKEERFVQSPILISAVKASSSDDLPRENMSQVLHPVSRRFLNANGEAHVQMDVSADVTYYCIQHEETGCELHLRFPSTAAKVRVKLESDHVSYHYSAESETERGDVDLVGNTSHFVEEQYDEEEEENSDLDHWEDDGFIAASSDEDEDVCQICHDGGHMIVCDGGDHLGCGSLFHLECIQRTEVPPGDWICQDCANVARDAIGINGQVGIEGYEFVLKPSSDSSVASDPNHVDEHSNPRRCRLQRAHESAEQSDEEDFQGYASSPKVITVSERSDSAKADFIGKENSNSRLQHDRTVDKSPWEVQRVAKRQCIVDSDDE